MAHLNKAMRLPLMRVYEVERAVGTIEATVAWEVLGGSDFVLITFFSNFAQ